MSGQWHHRIAAYLRFCFAAFGDIIVKGAMLTILPAYDQTPSGPK
jgi:hypothetical protein